MVKKKDGSSRMCIDYRKLNQKLVKDKFPLPLIKDVLDTLQKAKKGIVISYLDDLVIPAKNEKEGLEKLKIIFEVAKKYGLEIKFKKCQFLKKKIEFLGYIVESGTIKPSPTKTLAVRKFPEPTTIKQVQSFLGLTGYFRKGSAFTSKLFNDYCDEENIQHLQVATGVPRGNGQVERIHRTLILVLTKLLLDDSTKWYQYVDRLQRILNSTICCSTKWTPFELLVGTKTRNKEDILIKDLLLEEMAKELLEKREFLRNDAKKNIETLQSENRKTYNRRNKASLYKEGDLVAIQRTQFGAGLKLRRKFLGPYKVTKVNSKDRYEVEKVGQHEGSNSPTTSADLMKHFYA
ncbi:retrovirus-related Pol polyprotein from transposon 17.6 [Trichonephila clavipes]|nr:retrovirus-related Pol polyprotein from transposon 17.6 [Trichonephila clavipes]